MDKAERAGGSLVTNKYARYKTRLLKNQNAQETFAFLDRSGIQ
jgi:hypothetical protein